MSIASEITRLQGVKADILRAISEKGVEVPVGSALDDCPELISLISGGGGYKDGGQLVDADFMKVENNAVSSYDNVSRDPINFYFEPTDGEILNANIELTTAVNATVNVYVLKNGFYYLLRNIGGDTVTAGNDYKVNIIGDSYSVEQITVGGVTPGFAVIGNQTVKVYASLDKTVLFTSNDSFGLKNNVESINFATSVGWNILDNGIRPKFQAANIPLSNSGYFDGANWQNVGLRAIIFNGPHCDTASGYENVSSNPQGGDYGTGSRAYRASLVLYKLLSSKVAAEYGLVTGDGDNIGHGAGNLKARQFEQRNF